MNREKAQLRTVQSGEEPEKYIEALFALHDERAKQKGIKTTFSGESVYQFHKKIIHSLLKDGKVVLAFLYKESDPIASYYCIKHNQKYYYYQAGLSREGEKKSAGTVLFSLLIENAFKEHFKEFDFLRGNEEYKYFWTENYRKDYSIIIRKDDFINRITHYSDAIYRCILPPLRKMYKHFLH
jgi:CelD/BcsL family acetyltransferase involved in cellulose biosynthesis